MVTTCGNCQYSYAANREECPECGTKNPTPILPGSKASVADLTAADLRPEVLAFALAMERKLRANDHREGWSDHSSEWALERVREEADELSDAIRDHRMRPHPHLDLDTRGSDMRDTAADVLDEAVDVANFAMMAADLCGSLGVR